MKKKTSHKGSSVAKSAAKKKATRLSTAKKKATRLSVAKKKATRLSAANPRAGVTPGAVVLRLSQQQLRLLTGSWVRARDVIAEPYHVYRPPPGCGGGSPTGPPWIFWPMENLKIEYE